MDSSTAKKMLVTETFARDRKMKTLLKISLEQAIASGHALGPLKIVEGPHTKSMWMQCHSSYSRFRRGDVIELRIPIGGQTEPAISEVRVKDVSLASEGILLFELTRKRGDIDRNMEYFAFPYEKSFVDTKLIQKLGEVAKHQKFKKLTIFPNPGSPLKVDRNFCGNLNSGQLDALKYLLDRGLSGCVQGPPGTGKTELLNAIVSHAVQIGWRVGIAAFTNTAVDNALARVSQRLTDIPCVRAGDPSKIAMHLYGNSRPNMSFQSSLKNIRGDEQVIGATTHSWVLADHPPSIDLMIIDESGQVSSFMAPLLINIPSQKILLGDDKQLPPILTADHGNLIGDIFTLGRTELKNQLPMLDTQYRMNKFIQHWSSEHLYEGRLRPDIRNADRDILRNISYSGAMIGTHAVQLRRHETPSISVACSSEANLVAQLINEIISRCHVTPENIGVISPHRIHAGAICSELQRTLGIEIAKNVVVDTVERFQGQEREVMCLSFGNPFYESDPLSEKDEVEFIGDIRRINVAVTRAKSRFYCFTSENTLKKIHLQKSNNKHISGFLEWCETPHKTRKIA
jgi:DNA replication ATP-dependent helicase Dna2